MRNLIFAFAALFISNAYAEGPKTVWVNSYTRSDGTYVVGHWRSPPKSSSSGSYSGIYTPNYSGQSIYYEYTTSLYLNGEHFASCKSSNLKTETQAVESSLNHCVTRIYGWAARNNVSFTTADKIIELTFTKENCRNGGIIESLGFTASKDLSQTMICNLQLP